MNALEAVAPPDRAAHAAPRPAIRAGNSIDRREFAAIRRRMLFEGCKWDPQVGDVDTLASFPLFLRASEWRQLAQSAERLAAETAALESAVLDRPEIAADLGMPGRVRRAIFGGGEPPPCAARVMRFDFHPAPEGWRLSEVNSDVPGGYAEASLFTRLMAEQHAGCVVSGDPAESLADSLARAAGAAGTVVLLAAPGYMEDLQIVAYLAALLRGRGLDAAVASPTQLAWNDGRAEFANAMGRRPVAAIMRFYQGEWLARLPRRFGWSRLFAGGTTPVSNPGCAVISESKRLPLAWERLRVAIPTWRWLLPETRDPRDAPWRHDDGWIVKSAYSNTGDTVGHPELRPAREWREMRRAIWLRPGNWVAQRRFLSLPIDTPAGLRHVCVGVYTVDGRASGAYARLSPRPLIDFESENAALLIDDEF